MSLEYHQSKTIQLSARCKNDLPTVLDILKNDGLVALPTETVYGLAANGFSSAAILKVFKAKDRPANNPLILHTDNIEKASNLFDLSKIATKNRFLKLAHMFWPGPLTIVAKKRSHLPKEATAGLEQVAVRIPQNEVTNKILSCLDFPLVMPSANLSTRPSPTRAEHVLKTLDGRIDAVLDDGPCLVGIESTVVRIDNDVVEILRPGMIQPTEIETCLDEPVKNFAGVAKAPLCPGQSYLHYSPNVCVVKLYSKEDIDERWLYDDVIIAQKNIFSQKEKILGSRPKESVSIILNDDTLVFAQELYSALYQAEGYPKKQLSIVKPEGSEALAVLDRISRAVR